MNVEDKLTQEQRIRLECLAQAQGALPLFLQIHNGSMDRARAAILSMAKRYETYITSGNIGPVVAE